MEKLPFFNLLKIAGVINIVIIVLVLLLSSRLPPQVPLFYGKASGEEQLAPGIWLILPPVFCLAIISINTALSLRLTSDFLKRILLVSAIIATFFSTITVIKIFFLVGSF